MEQVGSFVTALPDNRHVLTMRHPAKSELRVSAGKSVFPAELAGSRGTKTKAGRGNQRRGDRSIKARALTNCSF